MINFPILTCSNGKGHDALYLHAEIEIFVSNFP